MSIVNAALRFLLLLGVLLAPLPASSAPAPLAASTLSYLGPAGSRTQLLLLDPIRRYKRVLASFDAPCFGPGVDWELAWSPDATTALVLFTREAPAGRLQSKLWRVQAATGKVSLLPAPPLGKHDAITQSLASLWADEAGEPVVETHARREGGWPGRTIVFEGQRYPVWRDGGMVTGETDEGDDYNNLLCHAWRLKGRRWVRVDTRALRDHDMAGLPFLHHAPSIERLLRTTPSFDLTANPRRRGNPPHLRAVTDPGLLDALSATLVDTILPHRPETWLRLDTAGRPCYLRVEMATEEPYFIPPVVMDYPMRPGHARPRGLGVAIADDDWDSVMLRDRFLLLGGEKTSRLLDLADPDFLFKAEPSREVGFVPLPRP